MLITSSEDVLLPPVLWNILFVLHSCTKDCIEHCNKVTQMVTEGEHQQVQCLHVTINTIINTLTTHTVILYKIFCSQFLFLFFVSSNEMSEEAN